MWFDAHCHLGWFDDPIAVARDAAEKNLGLLAVTVTPGEYLGLRERLAGEKNVALAAGLHPWWVRDARDTSKLVDLLPEARFVGEIGLDASTRHVENWEEQLRAFERICSACAETSGTEAPKTLSIHAVRAAGPVLDVLERTDAAKRCRCVLHWFSGSSDELRRAVQLGCLFSLGERSVATRRGREYARIIPLERLLTETDLPEREGSPKSAEDVIVSLERVTLGLSDVRTVPIDDLRETIASTSSALLGI